MPAAALAKLASIEAREWKPLVAAFFMFFTLLAAYYIVRPLREEMGNAYGKGEMQDLFTAVFVVMLAAVPFYGFVASRFPRRLVLPGLFAFFVSCLVAFWLDFKAVGISRAGAAAFYIWGSTFNLFAVSLFWSLMSELWTAEDGKRLFGYVSAGGTAGALSGSAITKGLLLYAEPINLLPIAAVLLSLSLVLSFVVRALKPAVGGRETEPAGGGIFDGALKVATNPDFARIALFVFLANVVGTFFYSEMQRQAATAFTSSAERVAFFNNRELIVSFITLGIEMIGTAAVLRRFGLTVALMALPLAAAINTLGVALYPLLAVTAAALVIERVVAFSLSSPAVKVMFTMAAPDEKYKVQSFIDTVVYRGGDATAGWLFKLVGAGAGFAAAGLPLLALALVAVWVWNAMALGRAYEARAQGAHNEKAAHTDAA